MERDKSTAFLPYFYTLLWGLSIKHGFPSLHLEIIAPNKDPICKTKPIFVTNCSDILGVLISPYPDQEWNKLHRPNSNICKPLKKKKKSECCPSNQVSALDEKWRLFNCFFQSGRAKDLSALLYIQGALFLSTSLNFLWKHKKIWKYMRQYHEHNLVTGSRIHVLTDRKGPNVYSTESQGLAVKTPKNK